MKYLCPKLGYSVNIKIGKKIHKSSMRGKIDRSISFLEDCDSIDVCGVKDKKKGYVWDRCVHPKHQ